MATTEQDQQQRTQAIQKREPVPFAPRSFDDGWRQAQALARSPLIPKGLKAGSLDETTANVMVVLMWGHELGVSPVQSLYNIHVIHGRPAVAAALKVGLVKQSNECLYFQCIESTATQATWETHRKGNARPTRITYTAEQAKRAGLLGARGNDDNWTKWTETMLRWRAGAMLADAEYPDVTRGLGTSDEQRQEEAPTLSAIPETRPVDVPALPEPQPTRTLERAPLKEELVATLRSAIDSEPVSTRPDVADPDVVSGQDMLQDVDAVQAEALAIIELSEVDGLTTKELDGLVERGMKLPDGTPKSEVSKALKAASKRIKGGGAK